MKVFGRTVAIGLLAVALQALMVFAFAWPASHLAPREVPLIVAGPAPAADAIVQRLDGQLPGAFAVTRLSDENAALRAINGRKAYGAIVVTPEGPRVLVASASSPAVAQQLTEMARQMSGRPGPAVRDVVPADPHDPRGAAFGALVLPLIMSSLAGGILLALLVGAAGWRTFGMLTFAVLGGLASAAIVTSGLSVLPGSYVAIAEVIGLTTLAVSVTVTGLAAAIGRAGIGLAALTLLLLANPMSGITSAPELLPRPWGAIGQAMPAGAGGTLMRSVAFFDGARAGGPLTVLVIWSAAGLLLLGVGALRARWLTARKGGVAKVPVTTS